MSKSKDETPAEETTTAEGEATPETATPAAEVLTSTDVTPGPSQFPTQGND